ncbi:MAG: hypothetical protein RMM58_14350 [Chloroflexota bacterium]|nr:hypothetical protein [Dehalococcoidia bacterium]MDW8255054.1 hypothetical protein [Chloroflexota bacterium]
MNRRALASIGLTVLLAAGCLPVGQFPQLLAPAATPTATITPLPPATPTPVQTPTPTRTPTAAAAGTVVATGTVTRTVTVTATVTAVTTPARTATPAVSPTLTGTVRPGTATSTPVRNTSTVNLRAADWNTIVSQEPAVNHPPPPPYLAGAGPFIEFKTPGSIPGFADLQDIIYGDISGDGREEAIIPIVSGGTAGTVGYLIYFAGDREPVFATSLTGYKLGARATNGQLVVLEPIYAGWEANCCPSGISETRYRLIGATLDRIARDERGIPEAIPQTVERFYQLLNERQFRDAYTFLSPEFQAANPYDRWVEGVAATTEIRAEASLIPGQNAASVNLTVTERTPSGQSTRRFSGRWNVIWSSPARQWLLHQPQLAEVR